MSLTLDAELEAAITAAAEQRGTTMEELARTTLRERFVPRPAFVPQDDWERELLKIGLPIGANLPDEALSREEMYE